MCVCVCSDTEVCVDGRRTLIILRCDDVTTDHHHQEQQQRGSLVSSVQLSSRCAVGTCDGCNYVLMMRSVAACPVCTSRDFHTYHTVCVDGRRNVITELIRYTHTHTSLSVSVSICMSVCLSLSLSLSVCLSVCLLSMSVYVSVLSLCPVLSLSHITKQHYVFCSCLFFCLYTTATGTTIMPPHRGHQAMMRV